MDFFYDLDCTIEDGEITKSEKIHLQKTESFEWASRELGYCGGWIFWWRLERTKILHRFWCNDNGTCMHSELAYCSFELYSCIEYFCILYLFLICFLEFCGFFERFMERDSWSSRDKFGKIIHILKWNS